MEQVWQELEEEHPEMGAQYNSACLSTPSPGGTKALEAPQGPSFPFHTSAPSEA